jgi:hypothetical protein
MAPYAFVGPQYDVQLQEAYTTIDAADVFEANSTPESLFESWPLRPYIINIAANSANKRIAKWR